MTGRLVAMLLAGLVVGVAAGWAVFSGGGSEGMVPSSVGNTVIRAPDAKQRVLPTPMEVPLPLQLDDEVAIPADAAPALIPEALFGFAEDTYMTARDTLGEPADASVLPGFRVRFEQGVLGLPGQLAREDILDAQRARALAASTQEAEDGSVNALLELLDRGEQDDEFSLEGDPLDVVVSNRQRGAARDGAEFALGDDPVTQGLVIHFPAGIHTMDERRLRGPRDLPFPTDVTIEGAGMDATLLRLSDISIGGDVERLTLRDLTIDCRNNGLFDLRSGNASLDIQRVRFVRFDAAHGGCDIFKGKDGMVLVMTDSEVLGGFGSSPGDGSLLSSSGSPVYAMRFTNVLFELVNPEFDAIDHGLFLGCRFRGMTKDRMHGEKAMDFRNCSFGDLLRVNYGRKGLQRSLDELFPGAADD